MPQLSKGMQQLLAVLIIFIISFNNVIAAEDKDCKGCWESPDNWFIYTIVFVLIIGSVLVIISVKNSLVGTSWSISDALSEEVTITLKKKDVEGNMTEAIDPSGKPINVTELRASSSRMIALMGMVSILIMFISFGAIILFSFAKTGKVPDSTENVINYMIAGLTLFAPYLVNKFAGVFNMSSQRKN